MCRRNLVTPRLTVGEPRSNSGSVAMLVAMPPGFVVGEQGWVSEMRDRGAEVQCP